jgi:hypothetical protein
MVTIYLDESCEESNGCWVVAGYLGNKDNWKKYLLAWPKALKPFKSPLHLKTLRLGSAAGARRCGPVLKRLGPIPVECGLRGFVGSAIEKEYRSKVVGTSLELLMGGYMMALMAVMDGVLDKIPQGERVEVIFEDQLTYAAERARAMAFLSRHPDYQTQAGPVVAKWSSMPKGVLTDASDYLSYAFLKQLMDHKSKKAILCAPIVKQQKLVWVHRNVDDIERSVRFVKESRQASGKDSSLKISEQDRKRISKIIRSKD